jgi:hypothetical protein
MIDWRDGASRCVEAEPQPTGCELKSRKRARRPTAGPAPAIQECICRMQTPGCWWRRRGETAPRGGTLVIFSSTVSVRPASERTGFRVAVGPRRRWADTGCLVAFLDLSSRTGTDANQHLDPAPRRHRADKASLGRLARDYRITPRPSFIIITPGGRSWQMSLSLSVRLCISASCLRAALESSHLQCFSSSARQDAKERG